MIFQIWGSFTKTDKERESPTTVSTFRKGQLMADGVKTMLEFEQEFNASEDEETVLLHEFDPSSRIETEHGDTPLTEDQETAVAFLISNSFMAGWWKDVP